MGLSFTKIFKNVSDNNLPALKLLLETNSSHINNFSLFDSTPIFIAADRGFFDVVKLLIDYKADVNKTRGNASPLYAAVCSGHLNIVSLLIQNGANVNFEHNRHITPLWVAIHRAFFIPSSGVHATKQHCWAQHHKDYLDIIRKLIHSGANVNAVSYETSLFSKRDKSKDRSPLGELIFPNVEKWESNPTNGYLNVGHTPGFNLATFGSKYNITYKKKLISLKDLMLENGAILTSYEASLFSLDP
ncbi:MAG: ankyrin repeat domain-containing protein [Colwellia sp.]|nr:ankyrin repeat domain-containing protein [Colwellia sp.]